MPPGSYPDDYYDRGRRHRSGSNRLDINYSGGRHRSTSRGHNDSPPNINIYNNADAYQEGPYHEASPRSPRGRAASGYGYGFPVMQPAAAPGVMPVMMAPYRSHSRSRSRSHSHSRSYYEEEEWRKRVIADVKRQEDEEKEARKQAIEKFKVEQARKEQEAEEAEAEAVRRHEMKIKDEEEKKKKAWEEYEAKRKAEEEKKKEEAKKADEEYKERMRKHLAKCGYAPNQIETIIEMESLKITNETSGTMVHRPRNSATGKVVPGVRAQVYPKIRRQDIAEETLKYYKLEWEYSRDDPNYIVILQEMTEKETDVLFAHTERLREKGGGRKILTIEERKDKGREPELLLVRRKSKNERSRSRTRDKSQTRGARFAAGVLGV